MADGTSKAIEDVRLGDMVSAIHMPEMPQQKQKGQRGWSEYLTQQMENFASTMVSVEKTTGYNSNKGTLIINNKINCTLEHAFWVQRGDKWMWQLAFTIVLGDVLYRSDGTTEEVKNLTWESGGKYVYNILTHKEVETYFAENYLVHNVG